MIQATVKPKKVTYPNAIINGGIQKGTTESESKNFLPKNFLRPQKNDAGSPIRSANIVEHIA